MRRALSGLSAYDGNEFYFDSNANGSEFYFGSNADTDQNVMDQYSGDNERVTNTNELN
jgi:hypothetical protein